MSRYCWRCATALPARPPITCAACGQPHYLNPRPCGEAVVLRDGRVLLMRRAVDPYQDHWDVPGGFCEAGEHPMHAAERELAEELALAARAIAYVGTWMELYGTEADGMEIHTATSVYLMELCDPAAEPRPAPEEATDARWFALEDLPPQLAFPAHARPMLKAVSALVAGTGDRLPDRTW
jgi:8-oxo-dGTP diphosphatase